MLEKAVLDHLKRGHEQLLEQGQLPSREKLKEYYATFRARFAPEKLRQLDGEELLNAMHAHGNHDSLVYWLEFKNDEEMPAIFGSISGGSALKFGIYRSKETGAWTQPMDVHDRLRPIIGEALVGSGSRNAGRAIQAAIPVPQEMKAELPKHGS
jgi:hypothetical protein